jgi:hypothetical protein
VLSRVDTLLYLAHLVARLVVRPVVRFGLWTAKSDGVGSLLLEADNRVALRSSRSVC